MNVFKLCILSCFMLTQKFLEIFTPMIDKYGILISFLGGFVTGESVIIALAFLSATGFIPIWYVLVFSTLGMYLSDFIPFTIGRFRIFEKFTKKELISKRLKQAEDTLQKYTKNNLFLILLYTKFIYGMSIPALIYLGFKKTPYSKFGFSNVLVNLIFVPFIVLIGWLSGRGFSFITKIFQNMRFAIFLLIVLIIILFFVRKWVSQKLIK